MGLKVINSTTKQYTIDSYNDFLNIKFLSSQEMAKTKNIHTFKVPFKNMNNVTTPESILYYGNPNMISGSSTHTNDDEIHSIKHYIGNRDIINKNDNTVSYEMTVTSKSTNDIFVAFDYDKYFEDAGYGSDIELLDSNNTKISSLYDKCENRDRVNNFGQLKRFTGIKSGEKYKVRITIQSFLIGPLNILDNNVTSFINIRNLLIFQKNNNQILKFFGNKDSTDVNELGNFLTKDTFIVDPENHNQIIVLEENDSSYTNTLLANTLFQVDLEINGNKFSTDVFLLFFIWGNPITNKTPYHLMMTFPFYFIMKNFAYTTDTFFLDKISRDLGLNRDTSYMINIKRNPDNHNQFKFTFSDDKAHVEFYEGKFYHTGFVESREHKTFPYIPNFKDSSDLIQDTYYDLSQYRQKTVIVFKVNIVGNKIKDVLVCDKFLAANIKAWDQTYYPTTGSMSIAKTLDIQYDFSKWNLNFAAHKNYTNTRWDQENHTLYMETHTGGYCENYRLDLHLEPNKRYHVSFDYYNPTGFELNSGNADVNANGIPFAISDDREYYDMGNPLANPGDPDAYERIMITDPHNKYINGIRFVHVGNLCGIELPKEPTDGKTGKSKISMSFTSPSNGNIHWYIDLSGVKDGNIYNIEFRNLRITEDISYLDMKIPQEFMEDLQNLPVNNNDLTLDDVSLTEEVKPNKILSIQKRLSINTNEPYYMVETETPLEYKSQIDRATAIPIKVKNDISSWYDSALIYGFLNLLNRRNGGMLYNPYNDTMTFPSPNPSWSYESYIKSRLNMTEDALRTYERINGLNQINYGTYVLRNSLNFTNYGLPEVEKEYAFFFYCKRIQDVDNYTYIQDNNGTLSFNPDTNHPKFRYFKNLELEINVNDKITNKHYTSSYNKEIVSSLNNDFHVEGSQQQVYQYVNYVNSDQTKLYSLQPYRDINVDGVLINGKNIPFTENITLDTNKYNILSPTVLSLFSPNANFIKNLSATIKYRIVTQTVYIERYHYWFTITRPDPNHASVTTTTNNNVDSIKYVLSEKQYMSNSDFDAKASVLNEDNFRSTNNTMNLANDGSKIYKPLYLNIVKYAGSTNRSDIKSFKVPNYWLDTLKIVSDFQLMVNGVFSPDETERQNQHIYIQIPLPYLELERAKIRLGSNRYVKTMSATLYMRDYVGESHVVENITSSSGTNIDSPIYVGGRTRSFIFRLDQNNYFNGHKYFFFKTTLLVHDNNTGRDESFLIQSDTFLEVPVISSFGEGRDYLAVRYPIELHEGYPEIFGQSQLDTRMWEWDATSANNDKIIATSQIQYKSKAIKSDTESGFTNYREYTFSGTKYSIGQPINGSTNLFPCDANTKELNIVYDNEYQIVRGNYTENSTAIDFNAIVVDSGYQPSIYNIVDLDESQCTKRYELASYISKKTLNVPNDSPKYFSDGELGIYENYDYQYSGNQFGLLTFPENGMFSYNGQEFKIAQNLPNYSDFISRVKAKTDPGIRLNVNHGFINNLSNQSDLIYRFNFSIVTDMKISINNNTADIYVNFNNILGTQKITGIRRSYIDGYYHCYVLLNVPAEKYIDFSHAIDSSNGISILFKNYDDIASNPGSYLSFHFVSLTLDNSSYNSNEPSSFVYDYDAEQPINISNMYDYSIAGKKFVLEDFSPYRKALSVKPPTLNKPATNNLKLTKQVPLETYEIQDSSSYLTLSVNNNYRENSTISESSTLDTTIMINYISPLKDDGTYDEDSYQYTPGSKITKEGTYTVIAYNTVHSKNKYRFFKSEDLRSDEVTYRFILEKKLEQPRFVDPVITATVHTDKTPNYATISAHTNIPQSEEQSDGYVYNFAISKDGGAERPLTPTGSSYSTTGTKDKAFTFNQITEPGIYVVYMRTHNKYYPNDTTYIDNFSLVETVHIPDDDQTDTPDPNYGLPNYPLPDGYRAHDSYADDVNGLYNDITFSPQYSTNDKKKFNMKDQVHVITIMGKNYALNPSFIYPMFENTNVSVEGRISTFKNGRDHIHTIGEDILGKGWLFKPSGYSTSDADGNIRNATDTHYSTLRYSNTLKYMDELTKPALPEFDAFDHSSIVIQPKFVYKDRKHPLAVRDAISFRPTNISNLVKGTSSIESTFKITSDSNQQIPLGTIKKDFLYPGPTGERFNYSVNIDASQVTAAPGQTPMVYIQFTDNHNKLWGSVQEDGQTLKYPLKGKFTISGFTDNIDHNMFDTLSDDGYVTMELRIDGAAPNSVLKWDSFHINRGQSLLPKWGLSLDEKYDIKMFIDGQPYTPNTKYTRKGTHWMYIMYIDKHNYTVSFDYQKFIIESENRYSPPYIDYTPKKKYAETYFATIDYFFYDSALGITDEEGDLGDDGQPRVVKKLYKLNANDSWKEYTKPIKILQPTTIYARKLYSDGFYLDVDLTMGQEKFNFNRPGKPTISDLKVPQINGTSIAAYIPTVYKRQGYTYNELINGIPYEPGQVITNYDRNKRKYVYSVVITDILTGEKSTFNKEFIIDTTIPLAPKIRQLTHNAINYVTPAFELVLDQVEPNCSYTAKIDNKVYNNLNDFNGHSLESLVEQPINRVHHISIYAKNNAGIANYNKYYVDLRHTDNMSDVKQGSNLSINNIMDISKSDSKRNILIPRFRDHDKFEHPYEMIVDERTGDLSVVTDELVNQSEVGSYRIEDTTKRIRSIERYSANVLGNIEKMSIIDAEKIRWLVASLDYLRQAWKDIDALYADLRTKINSLRADIAATQKKADDLDAAKGGMSSKVDAYYNSIMTDSGEFNTAYKNINALRASIPTLRNNFISYMKALMNYNSVIALAYYNLGDINRIAERKVNIDSARSWANQIYNEGRSIVTQFRQRVDSGNYQDPLQNGIQINPR